MGVPAPLLIVLHPGFAIIFMLLSARILHDYAAWPANSRTSVFVSSAIHAGVLWQSVAILSTQRNNQLIQSIQWVHTGVAFKRRPQSISARSFNDRWHPRRWVLYKLQRPGQTHNQRGNITINLFKPRLYR